MKEKSHRPTDVKPSGLPQMSERRISPAEKKLIKESPYSGKKK